MARPAIAHDEQNEVAEEAAPGGLERETRREPAAVHDPGEPLVWEEYLSQPR